jgi:hypothetical protein
LHSKGKEDVESTFESIVEKYGTALDDYLTEEESAKCMAFKACMQAKMGDLYVSSDIPLFFILIQVLTRGFSITLSTETPSITTPSRIHTSSPLSRSSSVTIFRDDSEIHIGEDSRVKDCGKMVYPVKKKNGIDWDLIGHPPTN